MNIIGISAYFHDSAACLIVDGEIIAAAQEERFTRKKHDASFPRFAIEFCLNKSGLVGSDIDYIVFYEKPIVKFDRIFLKVFWSQSPLGFSSFSGSFTSWVKDKLFIKSSILESLSLCLAGNIDWNKKLLFVDHHTSHAASAFSFSFEDAVVVTLDGVGEWATTTVSIGEGNDLRVQKQIKFPHSIGLLYSAFTYYLGFKVNSGEYKVMGLAPYGRPIYEDLILENIVELRTMGSFWLNLEYFNFISGLTMTSGKFHSLLRVVLVPPKVSLLKKIWT